MGGIHHWVKKMNKNWNYYINNKDVVFFIRDFKKCNDEKEKKILLDRLIKLLSYMIHSKIKVFRNKDFYDDLLQEGKIALIKAINDFDENRGPNFFKYADWCIKSNINLYMRWLKRNSTIKKKIKIHSVEENKTPYEYAEKLENKKILLNEIDKLPKKDKEILIMRYGLESDNNLTLRQIKPIISLSTQRISQIELKTLKKFREDIKMINYFE